ncbi:hypothetical protein RRG08_025660 [Elysia crispata]|uniref:Uncharacterized protein n=1 Tax=Elysia crispata TaxID=231223 RepID=A0AAE1CXV0_9GAST|nr:hypothetical protein RRG08_025660 [Elysia crispata]
MENWIRKIFGSDQFKECQEELLGNVPDFYRSVDLPLGVGSSTFRTAYRISRADHTVETSQKVVRSEENMDRWID